MKKLIYADDLLQAIRDDHSINGAHFARIREHIEAAPAVEARPVVQGRWVFGELDVLGQPVHCSVCGWGQDKVNKAMWLEYPAHKYCGCCGAKIDGGNEDGK